MGEAAVLRETIEELELDIERLDHRHRCELRAAQRRLEVSTSGGFLAFWLACSWGAGWWGHGWDITWGIPASLAIAWIIYFPLLLVASYSVEHVRARGENLMETLSRLQIASRRS